MSNAVRDANRVPAAISQSDASRITLPWQIDHITGRLLVSFSVVADAGGTVPIQPDRRDDNRVPAFLAEADNNARVVVPPVVDHRNSYLYANVIVT